LVSGFIEESLKVLLEEYCRGKASPNIQQFVTGKIGHITNCKTNKIKNILGEFSSTWETEFTNKIVDEIKNSIDSVVTNRHSIAHGKSVTMTYINIKDWYNNVNKAVDILAEIISPNS
jgi:ADP-dependent phosphofructokinase/glucokinase